MLEIAEEIFRVPSIPPALYLSRFFQIDRVSEEMAWVEHDRFVWTQNIKRTCLSRLWWFCWWLERSFTTHVLFSATTAHRQ